VLAFAVAALPLLLDRCVESCDRQAATVASAPPCHHTAAAGTRITGAPSACGTIITYGHRRQEHDGS
jgi:hypothetical protein